jgi:hypothetical protein
MQGSSNNKVRRQTEALKGLGGNKAACAHGG